MANKQIKLETRIESLKSKETTAAAYKGITTSIVKWYGDAFGGRSERATSNIKWSVWCIVWYTLKIAFKELNRYYIQITMHTKTHHCHVSEIPTSSRQFSRTRHNPASVPTETFHGRCEFYSHADTTVARRNCAILRYTDCSCNIAPFSDQYTLTRDIQIVSVATWYTSANGMNYIIVFNEVLYMGGLNHSFINPNQCRHFGAEVQDNPYEQVHPMTITVPDN